MTFLKKLDEAVQKNNSLLCIGLDTDRELIPESVRKITDSVYWFNQQIIDHTSDLVCAYKLNSAFYEAEGEWGMMQLKKTCQYINQTTRLPIILDAKRGDIGNTNKAYAKYAFSYLEADALTIHPYLGEEANKDFFSYKDKGFFILCKTSNKGSDEFQDLKVNGLPLYEVIASHISTQWNKNENCMLVVGATYPAELARIRKVVGNMVLLVPGVGTQGADIEKTIKAGLCSDNKGLIISSSRLILYASKEKDYAEKARIEAEKLRKEINRYRL